MQEYTARPVRDRPAPSDMCAPLVMVRERACGVPSMHMFSLQLSLRTCVADSRAEFSWLGGQIGIRDHVQDPDRVPLGVTGTPVWLNQQQ